MRMNIELVFLSIFLKKYLCSQQKTTTLIFISSPKEIETTFRNLFEVTAVQTSINICLDDRFIHNILPNETNLNVNSKEAILGFLDSVFKLSDFLTLNSFKNNNTIFLKEIYQESILNLASKLRSFFNSENPSIHEIKTKLQSSKKIMIDLAHEIYNQYIICTQFEERQNLMIDYNLYKSYDFLKSDFFDHHPNFRIEDFENFEFFNFENLHKHLRNKIVTEDIRDSTIILYCCPQYILDQQILKIRDLSQAILLTKCNTDTKVNLENVISKLFQKKLKFYDRKFESPIDEKKVSEICNIFKSRNIELQYYSNVPDKLDDYFYWKNAEIENLLKLDTGKFKSIYYNYLEKAYIYTDRIFSKLKNTETEFLNFKKVIFSKTKENFGFLDFSLNQSGAYNFNIENKTIVVQPLIFFTEFLIPLRNNLNSLEKIDLIEKKCKLLEKLKEKNVGIANLTIYLLRPLLKDLTNLICKNHLLNKHLHSFVSKSNKSVFTAQECLEGIFSEIDSKDEFLFAHFQRLKNYFFEKFTFLLNVDWLWRIEYFHKFIHDFRLDKNPIFSNINFKDSEIKSQKNLGHSHISNSAQQNDDMIATFIENGEMVQRDNKKSKKNNNLIIKDPYLNESKHSQAEKKNTHTGHKISDFSTEKNSSTQYTENSVSSKQDEKKEPDVFISTVLKIDLESQQTKQKKMVKDVFIDKGEKFNTICDLNPKSISKLEGFHSEKVVEDKTISPFLETEGNGKICEQSLNKESNNLQENTQTLILENDNDTNQNFFNVYQSNEKIKKKQILENLESEQYTINELKKSTNTNNVLVSEHSSDKKHTQIKIYKDEIFKIEVAEKEFKKLIRREDLDVEGNYHIVHDSEVVLKNLVACTNYPQISTKNPFGILEIIDENETIDSLLQTIEIKSKRIKQPSDLKKINLSEKFMGNVKISSLSNSNPYNCSEKKIQENNLMPLPYIYSKSPQIFKKSEYKSSKKQLHSNGKSKRIYEDKKRIRVSGNNSSLGSTKNQKRSLNCGRINMSESNAVLINSNSKRYNQIPPHIHEIDQNILTYSDIAKRNLNGQIFEDKQYIPSDKTKKKNDDFQVKSEDESFKNDFKSVKQHMFFEQINENSKSFSNIDSQIISVIENSHTNDAVDFQGEISDTTYIDKSTNEDLKSYYCNKDGKSPQFFKSDSLHQISTQDRILNKFSDNVDKNCKDFNSHKSTQSMVSNFVENIIASNDKIQECDSNNIQMIDFTEKIQKNSSQCLDQVIFDPSFDEQPLIIGIYTPSEAKEPFFSKEIFETSNKIKMELSKNSDLSRDVNFIIQTLNTTNQHLFLENLISQNKDTHNQIDISDVAPEPLEPFFNDQTENYEHVSNDIDKNTFNLLSNAEQSRYNNDFLCLIKYFFETQYYNIFTIPAFMIFIEKEHIEIWLDNQNKTLIFKQEIWYQNQYTGVYRTFPFDFYKFKYILYYLYEKSKEEYCDPEVLMRFNTFYEKFAI